MKRRTTGDAARPLYSSATSTLSAKPQTRRASIAKGDLRSFRLPFLRQIAEFSFGFLQILERQMSAFDHVRHHRLSAEQAEQFIDQPALGAFARDHGFED